MRKIPLRFGIPSLDRIVDPHHRSIDDTSPKATWTAAIVGPDGCGKSLLALHLASTYWQDTKNQPDPPRVIYVSTDLSYEQADGQWRNFGLDQPEWREQSVIDAYENCDRNHAFVDRNKPPLVLKLLKPVAGEGDRNATELVDFITPRAQNKREVFFLDLQSDTAGDDWGFINHLVGLLPRRGQPHDGDNHEGFATRHLLIIDAVEGLETFVGNRDAYGENRDRRSRVAQLIRRAMAIGVHTLFVVEEPEGETRLPEQFVTDLVLRLRHNCDGQYSQRTVEIEKCRAVAHVRGQHELSIRHGRGSTTGTIPNLNDPIIPWRDTSGGLLFHRNEDETESDGKIVSRAVVFRPHLLLGPDWRSLQTGPPVQYLSHIHVVPSLYFQSRRMRATATPVPELLGYPRFDLPAIDRLFPSIPAGDRRIGINGRCLGSIAVLLGETGTYKGRMARRYLSQAFRPVEGERMGVAVLLSTRFIDHQQLVKRIQSHLGGTEIASNVIADRVLCYNFGSGHLTAGAFIDIVRHYVQEAHKIIAGTTNTHFANAETSDGIVRRREVSYLIRIVLEDWNLLLANYPSLRHEPLLLSTVLSYFRREGVSALVVSTQPGEPGAIASKEAHELRNLDEPQLLAWSVPFYGDRRVAVTAHSVGTTHRAPIICELCPEKAFGGRADDEKLDANRHFDLYADVDVGRPSRVPLIVRLYLGNHAPDGGDNPKQDFLRMLEDTFHQLFAAPKGEETVRLEKCRDYERLFTFAEVLDDSHLDHTLVIQVDEYWASIPKSYLDLTHYWKDATVAWTDHGIVSGELMREIKSSGVNHDEDPIGIYHPHTEASGACLHEDGMPIFVPKITSRDQSFETAKSQFDRMSKDLRIGTQMVRTQRKRRDFFVNTTDGGPPEDSTVDRIPYLWDFGIILADRDLWKRHAGLEVDGVRVAHIWNTLCPPKHPELWLNFEGTQRLEREISWPEFLGVCRAISLLEDIPAFDVDLSTVETLSSWIFEMWASFQLNANDGKYDKTFRRLTDHSNVAHNEQPSLDRLLDECGGCLYQSLVLLVLSCPHFRARDRQVYRHHVSSIAVASREWYHTASAIMKQSPDKRFVPLSNSGSHSVRGDWRLAVAAGSRSETLAFRSLDLLSNRRNNLMRLQEGIGLPVRDVLSDSHNGDIPTAMMCFDEDKQRPFPLDYRDICSLGCARRSERFFWIWRSRIRHYHRDCFYWRRWIARVIEEQHKWFPAELRDNKKAMRELFDEKLSGAVDKDSIRAKSEELRAGLSEFNNLRRIIRSAVRDHRAD